MKTKKEVECNALIKDLFTGYVGDIINTYALAICSCGNVIGVFKKIDKDYKSNEFVLVDKNGTRYEYYSEYYEFLIESN